MKATIFSDLEIIGITDLKVGDYSMGGLFGEFVATDIYYKKIQKYVWDSSKPNIGMALLHSLKLNIQLENGMFLFPKGGYTFDDLPELPNEPKQISLAGVDCKLIDDYMLTQPPRPFVEEPWEVIGIEQKIAFENELTKELNRKQNFLSILKRYKRKHVLQEASFSAFCRDRQNDGVLFEIDSKHSNSRFALVHLTWAGKSEKDGFPVAVLYADYDAFKLTRMYPDKAEWES